MTTLSHARLAGREGTVAHDDPSLKGLEELFSKMDGKRFDDLLIEIETGLRYLTVGGGDPGYVCSIQQGDTINILLKEGADPEAVDDEETVWVIAGQGSDYPASQVVGSALARRCLRYYAEHGQPDPSLTWLVI